MNLEDAPVVKGQTVFFPKETTSGKDKFHAGEVIDLNEPVKAVKLRWVAVVKTGKLKSDWFPVAKLKRSIPQDTNEKTTGN